MTSGRKCVEIRWSSSVNLRTEFKGDSEGGLVPDKQPWLQCSEAPVENMDKALRLSPQTVDRDINIYVDGKDSWRIAEQQTAVGEVQVQFFATDEDTSLEVVVTITCTLEIKKERMTEADIDDIGDYKDGASAADIDDAVKQQIGKNRTLGGWFGLSSHFTINNKTGEQLHYKYRDDPNQRGALTKQKTTIGGTGKVTGGGVNIGREREWLPFNPQVFKGNVNAGETPFPLKNGTVGTLTVGFSRGNAYLLRCDPEPIEAGWKYTFDKSDTAATVLTCGWVQNW